MVLANGEDARSQDVAGRQDKSLLQNHSCTNRATPAAREELRSAAVNGLCANGSFLTRPAARPSPFAPFGPSQCQSLTLEFSVCNASTNGGSIKAEAATRAAFLC